MPLQYIYSLIYTDTTPKGVKHYTLWSIYELRHHEIVEYVERWISKHMPQARRWNYDDNSGERSFQLFHVHVYIEVEPYAADETILPALHADIEAGEIVEANVATA